MIPQRVDELDPAWLTTALQRAAPGVVVESVEVVSAADATNFNATLDLVHDAPTLPTTVFLKLPPVEPERRARLDEVADVITIDQTDDGAVDLAAALAHLRDAGHGTVLSEGGPTLNAQLIAADLVDEWNLTIAPALAAGAAPRPASGAESPDLRAFDLARCWRGERALFGRWVRSTVDRAGS